MSDIKHYPCKGPTIKIKISKFRYVKVMKLKPRVPTKRDYMLSWGVDFAVLDTDTLKTQHTKFGITEEALRALGQGVDILNRCQP